MVTPGSAFDCLHLNWAVPLADLPPPPDPLRFEPHEAEGRRYVFVSAVLSGQLLTLGRLSLSHPQLGVRICAVDEEGHPVFLIRRHLVPAWALPGARLVGGQPALAARFDFPQASVEPDSEGRRWTVLKGRGLIVHARLASPRVGEGPSLGSWEQTVAHFSRRPAYLAHPGGLQRLDGEARPKEVLPMEATLERQDLLVECLGISGGGLPGLHSAWLCPQVSPITARERETQQALANSRAPVAPDPAMFTAGLPPSGNAEAA